MCKWCDVWCKGSVAAVLERCQDKVGHGEAQAQDSCIADGP